MSELAHESTHSVEEVDSERALPTHTPPGAAVARFASGMGNQAFGSMVGGLTPAPGTTLARNGPPMAGPKGGLSGGVQVSSSGIKFTPEGTVGHSEDVGPVKVGAELTLVGEGELTWSNKDPSVAAGPKGGRESGGGAKVGGEAEIPALAWKNEANEALKKKAEKEFLDNFRITEVVPVVGGESVGEKGKNIPRGEGGSVSIGLKLKSVRGTEYTAKVIAFELGKDPKGESEVTVLGLGAEADVPLVNGEENWGKDWTLKGKMSAKLGLKIQPAWKKLGQAILDLGIGGAIEMAAMMGVIFAPAIAAWSTFKMNAERSELLNSLVKEAKDTLNAAHHYANVMAGNEPVGTDNPKAEKASAKAKGDLEALLAARKMDKEVYRREMIDSKGYMDIYRPIAREYEDRLRSEVYSRIHQWWEANDWFDDSKEGKEKHWWERIRIGSQSSIWLEESTLQNEAEKLLNIGFGRG